MRPNMVALVVRLLLLGPTLYLAVVGCGKAHPTVEVRSWCSASVPTKAPVAECPR